MSYEIDRLVTSILLGVKDLEMKIENLRNRPTVPGDEETKQILLDFLEDWKLEKVREVSELLANLPGKYLVN